MKLSVYLVLKLSVCLAIPIPGVELPNDNFYERQSSAKQTDLRVTSLHGLAHAETDVTKEDNYIKEDVLSDPLSLTGNKFDDKVLSSSERANTFGAHGSHQIILNLNLAKEEKVVQLPTSHDPSEINVLPFLFNDDFRSRETTTLTTLDPVQNVLRLVYGEDTLLEGSAVPLQSPNLANQNFSNHDDKASEWFSQHQLSWIKSDETKGHTEYISGISLQDKGQSSNNERDRHGSESMISSSRLSVSQSSPTPRIIVHNYGESSKIVHKDHIQEGSLHQAGKEIQRTNNGSPNENLLMKPTESVQQNYLAHGSQMHAIPISVTSVMSRNEHVQLISNPNDLRESFDPNAINNQQHMFNPGQFMQAMAPQTGSDPNNAKYRVSYNADEVNHEISQDSIKMPLQVPPGMSNVQRPSFDPDKLNSAAFNFRPIQMLPQMGAEVGANFQTSFDPSKINSITGGFQPNTVHINGQPKYDADEVNSELLAPGHLYIPWSVENGKSDSNKVSLPKIQDQQGYTSVPDQEQQGESKESVSQGTEHETEYGISQMQFGSFIPGRLYPGQNNRNIEQQKPAFLNSAGTPADGNGGTRLLDYERNPNRFDPNNVNAAQAAFDPDAMMRSLIGGHSNFKRDDVQPDNNDTFPSSSPTLTFTTLNIKTIEITQHNENANTSVNGESSTHLFVPSPTQDQIGFVPGQLAPGFSNYVFDPNTINQATFGVGNHGGVDGASGVSKMKETGQVNLGMGANPFTAGGNQVNASPFVHQGHIMNTNDTNENMNPYGNGFGVDAGFDPAAVNTQAMNFNYADMVGGNMGLGVQVDNNMGGFGFGGNGFDPNKINRAFGGAETNSSINGPNNMDPFLNSASGSFGGNTEYGAYFDPSKVNTATFDADSLNKAQMNFDPINMLLNNPGMTKDILKGATFDADKANAAQMQFNPMNMLINNPGMNKDVLDLITFDPNKINDQQNAFNPLTMFRNLFNTNTTVDGSNFANILFNPFGNAANLVNEQNKGPNSSMGSETDTVTTKSTQGSSIKPTTSGLLSVETSPSTTQEVKSVNSTNSN
ncbi:hypothetical protein CHS0354_015538 [Potamilus streckersoni]|uniref:Uncharacterized protein n=1 Tax=Potamilus streckersoni TaxID=2493646 RepID=A0AAE0T601_9BIVA|nr:hypothetical protein CHS0354_015538 [Potamilus streckersoni]